jgi:3-methyladenine DNA glycosylase AlkD
MMTVDEVMKELKAKGSESTKKLLLKHGMKEPFFGVKIGDMKVIQKKIKKDYALSKGLYDTGNADGMYFAGLIADETKMTKADLTAWVKAANSSMIIEFTVPWIAAESKYGFELGMKWIDDKKETIARAGWATLVSVMSVKADEDLDIPALKKLIKRVEKEIHTAPNRIRHNMNNFLIAAGSFVTTLTDDVIAAAKKIGEVEVNMGDTACKVPDAIAYIMKVKSKGYLGKKKKMARC